MEKYPSGNSVHGVPVGWLCPGCQGRHSHEPILTVYSLTTGLGSEVSTEPHFQDLGCISWEREALSSEVIKGESLDMAKGTLGGCYWRQKGGSKEMREKMKESKSFQV